MIGQLSLRLVLASALLVLIPPSPVARAQRDTTTNAIHSPILVTKSARKVKALLTLEVTGPVVQADEWSVFVPQVPELPGQADVRTMLFPQGKPGRELSDMGRPILFERIPSVDERWRRDLTVRASFEAILLERRLEAKEPGSPDPPPFARIIPAQRLQLLESGHQFDHRSPALRAWLEKNELRRKPREDEVDFARKVFLVVRKGIKYEGEKAEHLASAVCQAGKSDFAGITALYVAALRANGIPARALGGRLVVYEGKPSKSSWPHAKVEFYADRVGWVPADIAGAIRYNKSPDGLEYFGNDPGDFLTMHVGTDFVLDTFFGPKTLEWLPDPSWWVRGSGSVDGLKSRITVGVEVEPVELTEALISRQTRPAAKKPATKPARPGR